MKKQDLLKRTEKLIDQGENVLGTKKFVELSGEIVDRGLQDGFRTASLSFIKNLYGESHIYYRDFESRVKGVKFRETESGINILLAIKDEIENDWLSAIKTMISAEIFTDFLEMGKYLLVQNYKDAAAVMVGSVLEEHLRLLCTKNSIDIEFTNNAGVIKPKKADTMNADLAKANVYGILEQKNVTAWLDLRNKAAHGNYADYTKEQVEIMYQGVLNFIMTTK